MSQYFHSIRIDPEKCSGRMKCLRMCPTQAIRVRDGKAEIIEEKCIDCGECITVCPHNAIIPLTDPFGESSRFRHTVVMPSPALYAQFGREILPEKILAGIKKLGFDDAFDLSFTCGEVSFAIQEYLREYKGPKPLISTVRLLSAWSRSNIHLSSTKLSPLILPGNWPPGRSRRKNQKRSG
jgi:NAD-dependent dihydropyrimidine dehydrogenase PreA subunit